MNARDWLNNLSRRERNLVYAAATLLAIALAYLVFVLPLQTANERLEGRVEQKMSDLSWMQQAAGQGGAAAARGGSEAGSDESLVVLVDRTAREAGLGGTVRDQSPSGSNGLRLRLEAAPFDVVVVWLSSLEQQYGVRVDAASVDSTPTSGLVNASLTRSHGNAAG